MTATAGRRATYQDVLDASKNMVAEILDGEHLSLHPRRAGPHTRAGTQLGRVLGPFDRAGRGGREPGLIGTWSNDDRFCAEPFDAIELAISDLWANVEA